ncbi:hypothetical protein ACFLXZ_01385, partial [Chloroflexota bacterium]
MTNRRTLILDEDDLIMVVKKDVVQQVDENRGEMTRTEFVNFLIQRQLQNATESHGYIDEEEFHHVIEEIKGLLRNFLDCFLALKLVNEPQDDSFEQLFEEIQDLGNANSTE